jgi:sortase A
MPAARAVGWVRRLGLALIVCGLLALAWSVVVWRWQDPVTALYTAYEQHQLSHAYEARARRFRPAPAPLPVTRPSVASRPEAEPPPPRRPSIEAEARAYRLASHEGDPLGRIAVPRLGLDMVFVDGTSESSLEHGPGRDLETSMPGEDRLVYIAGHRTTYLAPFSHIDTLRTGDRITLELPYAIFVYSVTRHVVVPADDLAVLRPGHTELLALQACHPRFFASHRYIVYARPTSVTAVRAGDLRAASARPVA